MRNKASDSSPSVSDEPFTAEKSAKIVSFRRRLEIGIPSVYIGAVSYLTLYESLDSIALLPLLCAISYLVLSLVAEKSLFPQKINLGEKKEISPKSFFAFSFLVVLAGQILYWLAFYPGGFNLDALGQWDQVHGLMGLSNWHPVFTTACYWLITRIYDSFAFCIFVQLILFSLSVSHLLKVLYQLNIPRAMLLVAAFYISLNPAIGMNNVCLFKDVPFAIALVWMTVCLIRIATTKGAWLDSPAHSICFVVNLLVVALIRHNGIFYIAPIFLCLVVFRREHAKRIGLSILSFILSFLIVQGPVYGIFSVEQHSNFTGEVAGIPMAVMANNFVSDREGTPAEVEEFLLSIADEDKWRDRYVLGEWDSCKWDFGGIELLKGESVGDILSLTLSSITASPESAYQSIRENTRVVWQVVGDVEWDTWVYIEENGYGIVSERNETCAHIAEFLLSLSLTPLGTFLCWNIGAANIMLVVLGAVLALRKNRAKLLPVVPALTYNLLTMLLLSGPNHRYFFFSSVLVLPLVLFMLYDKS